MFNFTFLLFTLNLHKTLYKYNINILTVNMCEGLNKELNSNIIYTSVLELQIRVHQKKFVF